MQEDRNEKTERKEKDEVKDEEKDEELIIEEFSEKFPLLSDLKKSIRIRLKTLKAWPVAPLVDYLFDTMRVIKMDHVKHFPREIRKKVHVEPVIREIRELCEGTWEACLKICHCKEKLKEKQERERIDTKFKRFQYLLNEENYRSKLLRLK